MSQITTFLIRLYTLQLLVESRRRRFEVLRGAGLLVLAIGLIALAFSFQEGAKLLSVSILIPLFLIGCGMGVVLASRVCTLRFYRAPSQGIVEALHDGEVLTGARQNRESDLTSS